MRVDLGRVGNNEPGGWMSEEERLRDALDAWACWWSAFGRKRYTGAVLPPLSRTAEALDHRRDSLRGTDPRHVEMPVRCRR
jgi:hypothetical protein